MGVVNSLHWSSQGSKSLKVWIRRKMTFPRKRTLGLQRIEMPGNALQTSFIQAWCLNGPLGQPQRTYQPEKSYLTRTMVLLSGKMEGGVARHRKTQWRWYMIRTKGKPTTSTAHEPGPKLMATVSGF